MSNIYTVSLDIDLEADNPKEAAREFFGSVNADWDFNVIVKNANGLEQGSFTQDQTEDED